MIKSYKLSADNKLEGGARDCLTEYSKLCANYKELHPEQKIKVQLAKRIVWNVEINLIKSLLGSSRITEMEKQLLKDHLNILKNEAWECKEEVYRIIQVELPQNYQGADKFLRKIESMHLNLKAPERKRIINFEKYVSFSPMERIRLLISQKNMLFMEDRALFWRRDSLKIDEYEDFFLNYRIEYLDKCLDKIEYCIKLTLNKYFKPDSLGAKEISEEILAAYRYSFGGTCILKGKEYYRYPYDFKRPDDVPLNEWGAPDFNWNTGEVIEYKIAIYEAGGVKFW